MNNTNNFEIKKQILDKIKQYDTIIISRHLRPDGDAVGSTNGLAEILRQSFPNKKIYIASDDSSQYLSFLGNDGAQPEEWEYQDALCIVLDTGTLTRISNHNLSLAKEIIKIDHHIDILPYGDISWVEDWRSSLCEMIADFYYTFKDELVLNKRSATFLFTGMVTDTGRFKFSSVTGESMRLAGLMLDQGIDVDWLFANLNLEDFDFLKFKSYCYEKMQITENGVAYLVVDKAMQEKFNLSLEQASNSVSFLDSIRGSICWLAIIENNDSTYRVRLRSRFMTINKVAEKYRGGGHECACGATLLDPREIPLIVFDADQATKEYKSTHEGWL